MGAKTVPFLKNRIDENKLFWRSFVNTSVLDHHFLYNDWDWSEWVNEWVSEWVSEWEWEWDALLYVTCNDISVIYDGPKNKFDLRSGSNRHRHFVGFLTCPSKHWHGAKLLLRLFGETAPFWSPFKTRMGIRMIHSRLNPPPPRSPRRDWRWSILEYFNGLRLEYIRICQGICFFCIDLESTLYMNDAWP